MGKCESGENSVRNFRKGCRNTVNGGVRHVTDLGLSQNERKIENQLVLVG